MIKWPKKIQYFQNFFQKKKYFRTFQNKIHSTPLRHGVSSIPPEIPEFFLTIMREKDREKINGVENLLQVDLDREFGGIAIQILTTFFSFLTLRFILKV